MEGFSKIIYKDKAIRYVNYSLFQSDPDQKQKMLELLAFSQSGRLQQPLNSVLTLINVSNLNFDLDTLQHFKESINITAPYDKKIAVIGVTGLIKSAYKFVVGATPSQKIRYFQAEPEAKEWLVQEDDPISECSVNG